MALTEHFIETDRAKRRLDYIGHGERCRDIPDTDILTGFARAIDELCLCL